MQKKTEEVKAKGEILVEASRAKSTTTPEKLMEPLCIPFTVKFYIRLILFLDWIKHLIVFVSYQIVTPY